MLDMTGMKRTAIAVALLTATAVLAACSDGAKFNRAAYDICLAEAKKPGSRFASATFETFEKSTVGGSTGDDYFRVSIPYTLNGQPGAYQCIAEKLKDGTFQVVP